MTKEKLTERKECLKMDNDKNQCLYCDCYDPDMGCTMPSIDKSYACPLEGDTDYDDN